MYFAWYHFKDTKHHWYYYSFSPSNFVIRQNVGLFRLCMLLQQIDLKDKLHPKTQTKYFSIEILEFRDSAVHADWRNAFLVMRSAVAFSSKNQCNINEKANITVEDSKSCTQKQNAAIRHLL